MLHCLLLLPGVQALLGLRQDGLHLYRNMLPPLLPALAFVGPGAASSFNCPLTAGLQAQWLADALAGRLALPSAQEMQADVRRAAA